MAAQKPFVCLWKGITEREAQQHGVLTKCQKIRCRGKFSRLADVLCEDFACMDRNRGKFITMDTEGKMSERNLRDRNHSSGPAR